MSVVHLCLRLVHLHFSRGLANLGIFWTFFSGASMPVSSACCLLHIDVFEPVDLIHGHDLLNDDTFYNILVLAESGLIGAALAAPYCSKHSRATLRRPGPRPVRTPAHLDGVPDSTVDQQLSVQESSIMSSIAPFGSG